MKNILL